MADRTLIDTNVLVYRYDPRFPDKRSGSRSAYCATASRPGARASWRIGRCRRVEFGAAAYGLSWFDAHPWAFAEVRGIPELLSEDFRHGRLYGTVTVRNPFLATSAVTGTRP